jgi:anthranilate phosphoribosyltransferase
VAVAKHGNRAATSRSGSADVLEALGVAIDAPPETVAHCIDEVGVGFLFAAKLHPAMKHAMGPRRALGVRTIFNVLGPLTNPAGATRQLVGVFDPRRCEPLARALGALGSERVLVVHGFRAGVSASVDAAPGIDDLSPEGESLVVELSDGEVKPHVLRPEMAGLPMVALSEISGGEPAENAAALRRLLDGEPGPYRTAVQYSGAAALWAAQGGSVEDLPGHANRIAKALDDGAARQVLVELVQHSRHGGDSE